MTHRDGPPPLHFGDPDGFHWSAAVRPDESEDEVESYEVVGDIIRFMPDDSVTVPLWDATGLLSEDPVWLNGALGLSPELVRDIASWDQDWNAPGAGGQHFPLEQHRQRQRRLDAEAVELVARLRAELPPGSP